MSFSPRTVALPPLLVLFLGSLIPAQGGAVWMTDSMGGLVSGNTYTQFADVYLRTGPSIKSPCSGVGIADGEYYFQVTNPTGSVLLSSDPLSNRQVTVAGGVITATNGTHALGTPACGKVLELAPFNDSPSSNHEFKVWLTPVAEYAPGKGVFGFLPSLTETEIFRVIVSNPPMGQSIIAGTVFYDADLDGFLDPLNPLEAPIPGWRVEISINGVFQETFTDQNGRYQFIRDDDGTQYEIREFAPPPGYIPAVGATWLNTTPVALMVTASGPTVAGPDFGNVQFGVAPGVGRSKGFWHNQGESLLQAHDPAWRDALGTDLVTGFLRRPISTVVPAQSIFFVPPPPASFSTAFTTMSQWIVGLPAKGHAGYQLSVQVAATILNNTAGFMQGVVYIDRFQTGELQSLSSMLADVKVLLSDPFAGLTGPRDPFHPSPFNPNMSLRDAMLACLNEFTTINNTENAQEPQVVFTPKTQADPFLSPYDR